MAQKARQRQPPPKTLTLATKTTRKLAACGLKSESAVSATRQQQSPQWHKENSDANVWSTRTKNTGAWSSGTKWAERCEVQDKEFDAPAQRRGLSPQHGHKCSGSNPSEDRDKRTTFYTPWLRATDASSKEDMHSKRVRNVAGVTLSQLPQLSQTC